MATAAPGDRASFDLDLETAKGAFISLEVHAAFLQRAVQQESDRLGARREGDATDQIQYSTDLSQQYKKTREVALKLGETTPRPALFRCFVEGAASSARDCARIREALRARMTGSLTDVALRTALADLRPVLVKRDFLDLSYLLTEVSREELADIMECTTALERSVRALQDSLGVVAVSAETARLKLSQLSTLPYAAFSRSRGCGSVVARFRQDAAKIQSQAYGNDAVADLDRR